MARFDIYNDAAKEAYVEMHTPVTATTGHKVEAPLPVIPAVHPIFEEMRRLDKVRAERLLRGALTRNLRLRGS